MTSINPISSVFSAMGRNILARITQSPLKTIMVFAIVSRAFVFAVAMTAHAIFGMRLCNDCWNIGIPFLNLFSRWDSGYYAEIALRGYSNVITAHWEFFPGYPILMGLLGRLLAATTQMELVLAIHLAGFIISNLAFFGSEYYFYKLSMKVLSNAKLAYNSALFLAIYPAGVFLSAIYSDSLFLILTISSLYYWRLEKLNRSALLGFLAALTRPIGVLLIVPYLYELLVNSPRRKVVSSYLPVVSILLGYLSFMAYSQLVTRTPFANFEAERLFWGVTLNLHDKLVLDAKELLTNPVIIVFLVLSVGATIASVSRRRSRAETAIDLYAICLLLTYLVAPLDSFPRYSLTLIPAYWTFSRWSERLWAKGLIYAAFLALLGLGTGLFVNWYSFY